jgi:hypothetical protein
MEKIGKVKGYLTLTELSFAVGQSILDFSAFFQEIAVKPGAKSLH